MPDRGTEEGIDVEAKLVHTRDACGQRDKGANHWQQATDEDGDPSVAREEVFGAVEVAVVEQHEAAIFCNKGPAAISADPVGNERAEVAANGSGCGHS
jgi:hypothetical protein